MSSNIQVQVDQQVLQIRMNRPEKKNALTRAMYNEMAEILEKVDSDDAVHVVLITGAADSFTSGNDVKDFMEVQETWETSSAGLFLKRLALLQKPIVAAVNGIAVGIGTTMLLHCDLVYASGQARFQFPFTQLGLVPEAGSSFLLPRLLGHPKAAELLLLGEPFDADKALELGIINGIFPGDTLLSAVSQKAQQLAQLPPQAVRSTKGLMKQNVGSDLTTSMNAEGSLFFQHLQSDEAKATFMAFLQKKK